MDIANRRVLITGASRGLGRTLAFAFAAAGAREVFAGARQPEDIEKLKSAAAANSAPITPIKLDVTSEDDVNAAANLGFIDITGDSSISGDALNGRNPMRVSTTVASANPGAVDIA